MFIEPDSTTGTLSSETGVGGGGGTPLFKLYRYVPPHRVRFLRRFGLKTDMHSAHFGLESGMVFEGTTGVYEHFQMSKKEREICEFQIDLNNFCVFALI